MIEITFNRAEELKKLVDAMKEIVAEVSIVCNEDGIRVIALDPTSVAMVHLRMNSSELAHYRCDSKDDVELGVQLATLQKMIRCLSNDAPLTLSTSSEGGAAPDELRIRCDGAAGEGGKREAAMKLQPVMAMDEVPEIDPHVHAELPAGLVADFFRDVAAIGETLTVGTCEERFAMQVKTDYETFAAEFDSTLTGRSPTQIRPPRFWSTSSIVVGSPRWQRASASPRPWCSVCERRSARCGCAG